MKLYIKLILVASLGLSSCLSTNKIFVISDDFKAQNSVKLSQTLNGYSDESRGRLLPDYYVTFKHYYGAKQGEPNSYELNVRLNTSVRAYEVDPIMYFYIDGEIIELESEEQITKMYQKGSTTTSLETSTTTTEDESDDSSDSDEKESKTETTTSYSTTSSHNTYLLMQLKFKPDREIMQKIARGSDIVFKLYIENEGIDIPLKRRYKKRYKKYLSYTDDKLTAAS